MFRKIIYAGGIFMSGKLTKLFSVLMILVTSPFVIYSQEKNQKTGLLWNVDPISIEHAAIIRGGKNYNTNDVVLAFVISTSIGFMHSHTVTEYSESVDVSLECSLHNAWPPNIIRTNGFMFVQMPRLQMRKVFIVGENKKLNIPYRLDISLDTYAKEMKILMPCDPFADPKKKNSN